MPLCLCKCAWVWYEMPAEVLQQHFEQTLEPWRGYYKNTLKGNILHEEKSCFILTLSGLRWEKGGGWNAVRFFRYNNWRIHFFKWHF